jgi:hypothetical protein
MLLLLILFDLLLANKKIACKQCKAKKGKQIDFITAKKKKLRNQDIC